MIVHKLARPTALADVDPVRVRSAYDLQAAYLDDVLRYVSAFVKPPEEAEDVTMQVLHAAFANLNKLRRGDDPKVWLLGIARRKAFDSLRSSYRRREAPLAASQHLLQDSSAAVDQAMLISQVLDQLPAEQAQALVLKYVNELTTEEVGTAMGRSGKAANSLIQRARESFYAKGAVHFSSNKEALR
jgi:RNA polymerase sigma factor (sigma-70 family)